MEAEVLGDVQRLPLPRLDTASKSGLETSQRSVTSSG